ncbi:MAG: hypothetical protein IIB81_04310 [Nanoarchaeota archaeon]|nr:hypothetical protein [Nanoarchaeota archaeon]
MICGFNRVIEKCHIIPKAKGGKECIWLCPNHHTLFDRGELTKEEFKKILKRYEKGVNK